MKGFIKPLAFAAQILLCIVVALIVLDWSFDRLHSPYARDLIADFTNIAKPHRKGRKDHSAGNSTLGFEAILALSQGTKWRVDGLRAAAGISGIEIQIPAQPGWSDNFTLAFQAFGPVEARGAALAWLGHIDLLKLIIMNRWSSALVLEDDVDWDVSIREQTYLAADAVRKLTHESYHTKAPYGLFWDVLWMGHCSDPADFERPHVVYDDPSSIPHKDYHGISRYITTLLEEGQRSVHYSLEPLCTFAYAVTARGAMKLLQHAMQGRGGAFDLMLMHACQDGVVECISVNPEIFDPYQPGHGRTSEVSAADHGEVIDAVVGDEMGWTDNTIHSARCAALFDSTCPSTRPPRNPQRLRS